MRGKDDLVAGVAAGTRITPAYAGKRLTCYFCPQLKGDHPRLCGEKQVLPCPRHSHAGSPPPMRGKGPEGTIICTP